VSTLVITSMHSHPTTSTKAATRKPTDSHASISNNSSYEWRTERRHHWM